MEIGKVNVPTNVNSVKESEPHQDYSQMLKYDQDIIDQNVKYAAEQNKKKHEAEMDEAKAKLAGAQSSVEIFNRLGMEAEADEEGNITLSHYSQPAKTVTFADMGIDEAKLMENVKEIKGDANFDRTSLTSVDSLQKVGGKLNTMHTKIKSMKNLEEIGGIAQMNNSLIEELPKLKSVGAMASMSSTKLKELPALEVVNGNLDLQNTPIEKMPALKKVKGDVNIINTGMTKDDVTAEVGGKVKDKKDPVLPIKTDYSYLWDNSDRVEHFKKLNQ